MPDHLASAVSVQQGSGGTPPVTGAGSYRIGIVGVTERGPFGGTLVQEWEDYVRLFGGFTTSSEAHVAKAVWSLLKERGTAKPLLYISRVVHLTANTPTSEIGTVTLVTAAVGTTVYDTLRVDGKTDGVYAAAIKAQVADASDGVAGHFNFYVQKSGVIVERFPNCTMDDTDLINYVETKVNAATSGSRYVTVTDLDASCTADQQRPVNVTSSYLAGGDDGLTDIADADYVGSQVYGTGIYGLDAVADLNLLLVPGKATATISAAMRTYCDTDRAAKCFAIHDPPASLAKAAIGTYQITTAALKGTTQTGAIYWPRVRIGNPDVNIFGSGASITVAPSGHIAGVFARVGAATKRGRAETPAGYDYQFYSVIGFEGEDDERLVQHEVCAGDQGVATRNFVFPNLINPLNKDEGSGFYIDGEYTLKISGGGWPTVGQMLGAQYTMLAVKNGLEAYRHKNMTVALYDQVRDSMWSFLKSLCDDGFFASTDPDTAFYVDVGQGLNNAQTRKAFTLKAKYGIAMAYPGIFIDVEVDALNPDFVTQAA